MATEGLSFFTHVRGVPGYLAACDSFFPGNGKIARYSEGGVLKIEENKDHWLLTAARIIALGLTFVRFCQIVSNREWKYLDAVVPLIFLAKVYFRMTTQFHVCPSFQPVETKVNIPEAIKPTLNLLFGNVDKLPICSHEAVGDSKKLTHPIMKGAFGSAIPFIVVKVRCLSDVNAIAILELFGTTKKWCQVYREGTKSPQFFPFQAKFTDENGELVREQAQNFGRLQEFIKTGYYTDDDGCEWQIVR